MTSEIAPKPRAGRGIKIVLAVSLALNLLVVGVLAGGALRARMAPDVSSRTVVHAMWGALPDEVRADLRGQFAQPHSMRSNGEGAGLAPSRAQRRVAQGAALSGALRAEPFDVAMMDALLRGDGSQREARAAQMRTALVAALAQLSPPERAAVAARFEAALLRRGAR